MEKVGEKIRKSWGKLKKKKIEKNIEKSQGKKDFLKKLKKGEER